jgi:hypothetical protein
MEGRRQTKLMEALVNWGDGSGDAAHFGEDWFDP